MYFIHKVTKRRFISRYHCYLCLNRQTYTFVNFQYNKINKRCIETQIYFPSICARFFFFFFMFPLLLTKIFVWFKSLGSVPLRVNSLDQLGRSWKVTGVLYLSLNGLQGYIRDRCGIFIESVALKMGYLSLVIKGKQARNEFERSAGIV